MLSIKVPPLGESIVEATVGRWMKKEGDRVAAGDTLVELETDKITVEVPAPKAGVLMRRARAEGDTVKVDDMLAELDETATGTAAETRLAGPAADAPATPPAATPAPTAPAAEEARTSPAVRRMAAEDGVN
ncbi:MAG: dihydrolipoamide succinyltransferase, partial [Gemmatimonadota bacterium]|nr:dihydrolipoamide succinyltransferase [Gemmatimonadota bacterium]